MSCVLALMNEKGGVGKSSLTYACAWELAAKGKKVLMVDMDGQMANLTYLTGTKTNASTKTMNDVLLHDVAMKEAVVPVETGTEMRLDLLPATTVMADAMTTAKLSRMKKAVSSLKRTYDYIFLDVNPSPDWKHALTLSVLDGVVIVMLPDVLSLEANMGIVESIDEIREGVNPKLKVMGILLNQYNSWTNLAKTVEENAQKMADQLQTEVFQTKVRKAVAVGESAFSHKGITAYAKKSMVAGDIRALADEIEEKAKRL